MNTLNDQTIRTHIAYLHTKRRYHDFMAADRGEISSSLVWVAGFVLAAILVVGILYAKLTTAAQNVEVDPGIN